MKARYFSQSSAGAALICTALLLLAAPATQAASGRTASVPSAHMSVMAVSAPQAPVIVKLGEASLEEYRHGDPGNRIQLLRGSQAAQKATPVSSGKCRS